MRNVHSSNSPFPRCPNTRQRFHLLVPHSSDKKWRLPNSIAQPRRSVQIKLLCTCASAYGYPRLPSSPVRLYLKSTNLPPVLVHDEYSKVSVSPALARTSAVKIPGVYPQPPPAREVQRPFGPSWEYNPSYPF